MGKLFCDCKTDEEKSNFFLSGRAFETGIIAYSISNDVAMAYHRCAEMKKEIDALRAKIEAMEKQEPARLVTPTAYRWRRRGSVMWQYGELTEETARLAKEHNHEVQALGILPDAIARLVESGTSGKWHGVNCYVKTFDGDTIEARESISEVMGQIKSAQENKS